MAYFGDDIPGHMRLARRRDSDRLVVLDVNEGLTPGNDRPVTGDDICPTHPIAQCRDNPVDGYPTRFDALIRLAPGTNAMFGKKLIDADGGSRRGLNVARHRGERLNEPGDRL
jgi:hypothetical protein